MKLKINNETFRYLSVFGTLTGVGAVDCFEHGEEVVYVVEAGKIGYAFWAVLASLMTLASFMKVMKYAFFGKLGNKWDQVKEVPPFMRLSAIILAAVCLIGGILLFPAIKGAFLKGASDVLSNGLNYASIVLRSIQ